MSKKHLLRYLRNANVYRQMRSRKPVPVQRTAINNNPRRIMKAETKK